MNLAQVIVLLVALQRLVELAYARRSTRRLLEMGGIEVGKRHYPFLVAVHTAWLATLYLFVPPNAGVDGWWLGLFLALQGARLWVIASLGRYWTTRVVTVPGAPLVARGPYRYLRHPNYAIVAAEILVLPLVFGAWQLAVVFSALNAGVLVWRIRVEDAALAARRAGHIGGAPG